MNGLGTCGRDEWNGCCEEKWKTLNGVNAVEEISGVSKWMFLRVDAGKINRDEIGCCIEPEDLML